MVYRVYIVTRERTREGIFSGIQVVARFLQRRAAFDEPCELWSTVVLMGY